MQVSIIIISYNTREVTRACLQSIYDASLELEYEIILVDNASEDGSVEMVESNFPEVRLIANRDNLLFSKANNQAMAIARGDYFLLLNSDTIVKAGNMEKLYSFLIEGAPKVGCVGPTVLNKDGSLQSDGYALPAVADTFCSVFARVVKCLPSAIRNKMIPPGHELIRRPEKTAEVGRIMGCCMLFPAKICQELGGLDETFELYSEEVGLCCRLKRAGYETWRLAEAEIIHLGRASTKNGEWASDMMLRGQALYIKKHFSASRRVSLFCLYLGYSFLRGILYKCKKIEDPFELYNYYRKLQRKDAEL